MNFRQRIPIGKPLQREGNRENHPGLSEEHPGATLGTSNEKMSFQLPHPPPPPPEFLSDLSSSGGPVLRGATVGISDPRDSTLEGYIYVIRFVSKSCVTNALIFISWSVRAAVCVGVCVCPCCFFLLVAAAVPRKFCTTEFCPGPCARKQLDSNNISADPFQEGKLACRLSCQEWCRLAWVCGSSGLAANAAAKIPLQSRALLKNVEHVLAVCSVVISFGFQPSLGTNTCVPTQGGRTRRNLLKDGLLEQHALPGLKHQRCVSTLQRLAGIPISH